MRLPRFISSLLEVPTVHAHCDLPCGVYDPAQARIEAESLKAICEKVAANDDADFRVRAAIIKEQRSEPDKAKRDKLLAELQTKVAEKLPTLPFLQGAQVSVAGKDVKGIVLDPSFKLHMSTIHK